jgi:hypothetical protein
MYFLSCAFLPKVSFDLIGPVISSRAGEKKTGCWKKESRSV